jgi:hypothetical protein
VTGRTERHKIVQFVGATKPTRDDVVRLDLSPWMLFGASTVNTVDSAILARPTVALVTLAAALLPGTAVHTQVFFARNATAPEMGLRTTLLVGHLSAEFG